MSYENDFLCFLKFAKKIKTLFFRCFLDQLKHDDCDVRILVLVKDFHNEPVKVYCAIPISLHNQLKHECTPAILTFFETCRNSQKSEGGGHAGCRIAPVPRAAKFLLPLRILFFFFNVSAAQPPRGSIHAPVACGLHCPRPKDCPGLGNPNTLK